MKNFLLTTLLVAGSFAVQAQVSNNTDLTLAKASYNAKYQTEATSMVAYDNKEVFANISGNANQWAVFTDEGVFLQTETVVPESTVPAAIKTDVNQRFTNGTNTLTYRKVEKANNTILYSVHYTKGNSVVQVYYNPTGEMVSRAIR